MEAMTLFLLGFIVIFVLLFLTSSRWGFGSPPGRLMSGLVFGCSSP